MHVWRMSLRMTKSTIISRHGSLKFLVISVCFRSVLVAERLALPTSVHGVAGSNPAGGEILPEPKRHFIAQSFSCSPFHRLEMTEILLKGRKTLTHPSVCFRPQGETKDLKDEVTDGVIEVRHEYWRWHSGFHDVQSNTFCQTFFIHQMISCILSVIQQINVVILHQHFWFRRLCQF